MSAEGSPPADPIAQLEREKRALARRLTRCEQAIRLLQELQHGNTNLLSSLLNEVESAKARSDELLRNILPQDVIDRLEDGAKTIADGVEEASIVFSDFVGFTTLSSRITPQELVETLDGYYSAFDDAAQSRGVEKIKTIGDAYLAATGLSGGQEAHAEAAAAFALEMRDIVVARSAASSDGWQMRVGLHSGPLTAGVIGKHKFAYDIWGDTVNIAARVQSVCRPGEVTVSAAIAERLNADFRLGAGREVELKGRGSYRVFTLDWA